MAIAPFEIMPPVGGLFRASWYQGKPPYFTEDCLNVRGFDVLEGRGRVGSRPGYVKHLSTQLGGSTGATSGSLDLDASADTYIRQNLSTTNFGTATTALVGVLATTSQKVRALLHYDASALPVPVAPGLILSNGYLWLKVASVSGSGEYYVTRLRRDDWVEAEATWTIYKTANNWTTAGADSSADDHDTTDQVEFTVDSAGWKIIDVTTLIQDAADNHSEQIHFLIRKKDESTPGVSFSFYTKEHSNAQEHTALTANWVNGTGTTVAGRPIRLLSTCRNLDGVAADNYPDPFDGSALGSDWTDGDWGDSTLPTVTGGQAYLDNALAAETRAAILTGVANISTTAARSVAVNVASGRTSSSGSPTQTVSLLLDTRIAAAGQNEGVRASLVYDPTLDGNYRIKVYINGVQVGSTVSVGSPASETSPRWFKLSIDASNTIQVFWTNAAVPDFTYLATSYTPVQTLAGFELSQTSTPSTDLLLNDFKLEYIPDSAGAPPTMLVASSNGRLFYETTTGEFAEANYEGGCTLPSDRLLFAAPYLQKLYIADHGIAASGTNGTVSFSTPNGTLTDAGQDFAAAGVTVADYRVEILPEGAGTIGIYELTAVGTDTVTFTGNGGAVGGVHYRLVRTTKVFDSATRTLSKVQIGTIGSGDGQFPLNCRLIATYQGSLVLSGDSSYPNFAYASKSGDPDNWLFALRTSNSAYAWDPTRLAGSAGVGDEITALIPHRDDYLIFGCRHSMYLQRGSPTRGGLLDIINSQVGVIAPRGFARTPDQHIIVLTTDGLYRIPPTADSIPQPLSRRRIPRQLVNIDAAFDSANPDTGYEVLMEYSVQERGVDLYITPRAVGPTHHWFYDYDNEAFWPQTIPTDLDPTAIIAHSPFGGTQTVIVGCRDGYTRRMSADAESDDGTNFDSEIWIGPFRLGGNDMMDGILHDLIGVMDAASGSVTAYIVTGATPQAAKAATPFWSGAYGAGRTSRWPRLSGIVAYIKIVGTPGAAWAMEPWTGSREPRGFARVP